MTAVMTSQNRVALSLSEHSRLAFGFLLTKTSAWAFYSSRRAALAEADALQRLAERVFRTGGLFHEVRSASAQRSMKDLQQAELPDHVRQAWDLYFPPSHLDPQPGAIDLAQACDVLCDALSNAIAHYKNGNSQDEKFAHQMMQLANELGHLASLTRRTSMPKAVARP